METSIDQSDYLNFEVGCSAEVTFNALPGKTYTGKVTRIAPSLTDVTGYNTFKGWVEIDTENQVISQVLPLDLIASVDVICKQVKNVLMISVDTLHNVKDNTAYVYVLNSAGKPEKRQVTTGLSNDVFVEIKSGLQNGEKVITSAVPDSN